MLNIFQLGQFGKRKNAPPAAAGETHRYWRLRFHTDAAPGSSFVRIWEVQMRGTVGGADLTGSGTASASAGVAANAFDNNTGTNWTASEPFPQTLQYDFGTPTTIAEYTLQQVTTNAGYPYIWDFQYSDDGSAWTTVDTQNPGGFTTAAETRAYAF